MRGAAAHGTAEQDVWKQFDIDEMLVMGKQTAVDYEIAEDRVGEFDVISKFEEVSLEKSHDA